MSNERYPTTPQVGDYDPDPPAWTRDRPAPDDIPDEETLRAWDESLPPPPLLAHLDRDDYD